MWLAVTVGASPGTVATEGSASSKKKKKIHATVSNLHSMSVVLSPSTGNAVSQLWPPQPEEECRWVQASKGD